MAAKQPRTKITNPFRKTPRTASNPPASKRPRMPEIRGGPLVWRFSSVDREGPFAWTNLAHPPSYKEIMEKLHNFETMHETEIRAQGSHPVEISLFAKTARDRLGDIQLDDIDEMMSFRITGAGRVWCRMDRNMMLILWWDPQHEVCPSIKK
jgi:hypothetical protein